MIHSAKVFSLEEANRILPRIASLISVFLEKREVYNRMHDALFMGELIAQAESNQGTYQGTVLDSEAQTMEDSMVELKKIVDELTDIGCLVRNIEKGWIDFLGRHNGKTVYFCWHRDEKSVQYYHPVLHSPTERFLINS